MRATRLWQIRVTTSPEAEEAVGEVLTRVTGVPASAFTDFRTRATAVSVFVDARGLRDWKASRRSEFFRGLQCLVESGVSVPPARTVIRDVPADAWRESWKRHFKPLRVGKRLVVQPSWCRRRADDGQEVVVLDPGLSFGTGQHPTTLFCLEQLVWLSEREGLAGCLDIGTGSGILAIAAAKLGFLPVRALELDPEALRVALLNARRNRVQDQIEFQGRDLARLSGKSKDRFGVVCANLEANLLQLHRERILARLAPGGALLLAGILRTEFRPVQAAYERAGLKLKASRTRGEWRSGMFMVPPDSR